MTVDTVQLKSRVNLYNLAGRYTRLEKC
jgi:hypothetical protein